MGKGTGSGGRGGGGASRAPVADGDSSVPTERFGAAAQERAPRSRPTSELAGYTTEEKAMVADYRLEKIRYDLHSDLMSDLYGLRPKMNGNEEAKARAKREQQLLDNQRKWFGDRRPSYPTERQFESLRFGSGSVYLTEAQRARFGKEKEAIRNFIWDLRLGRTTPADFRAQIVRALDPNRISQVYKE